MQQVFHAKAVFDELELVVRISTTRSKTSHGLEPNNDQER
jgi:hypothetical protein